MFWQSIKKVTLFLILTFLFCFALEISLRLYEKCFRGIPFFKTTIEYYDSLLGWSGKKIFADPSSKKYKILIIGDSFTHGMGVPESDMYYAALKNKLNADLFVYGGPGYGTLQEYLVLNKYYDQIQPDLIILQVCSNDFINNSWELESRSFYNNTNKERPYLRSGNIQYLFPRTSGNLKEILSAYSRVLYRAFGMFEKIYAMLAKKHYFGFYPVEERIIREGANYEYFRESIITTDVLVKKIKNKVGQTPVVAFMVNHHKSEPYLEEFQTIFNQNQILFIDGAPGLIGEKAAMGASLFLSDGNHWNVEGNRIAGDFLAEELYRLGYHK